MSDEILDDRNGSNTQKNRLEINIKTNIFHFFTDVLNATRNLASNGLRGYATTLASAFAPIATGTPWLKLQPELFTIGTFHPDLCHKQPNNICF